MGSDEDTRGQLRAIVLPKADGLRQCVRARGPLEGSVEAWARAEQRQKQGLRRLPPVRAPCRIGRGEPAHMAGASQKTRAIGQARRGAHVMASQRLALRCGALHSRE